MQRIIGWAIGLVAMLGAASAPAYAQRTLEVPATSGWKHAVTGLILRAQLAGFQRDALTDSTDTELDVAAQFEGAGTRITVFLFHPALRNVPIWFDRSESLILMRDDLGAARPLAAVQAFAAPGATTPSALRRVYVPGKGPFTSTGLAVMPLGEWLVAIRISSMTLDPAQLDARLSEAIAGIGWPTGVAEAPAAAPIAACAGPLDYARRARIKKPSMNDALLGAIMPAAAADAARDGKAEPGPSLYCRDLPPKAEYSVYRAPDETSAYVMALGDAGLVISVAPSLSALIDKSPAWGVSLGTLDGGTDVYPSFDKLAHPDQVWKAFLAGTPIARSSGGDNKTITIGVPAK